PRGLPGVAPVAQQQGKYVAEHIVNTIENKTNEKFVYTDKGSMATVGRSKAVADLGKVQFKGYYAWTICLFIYLVSIFVFRNNLVILVCWIFNFFNIIR